MYVHYKYNIIGHINPVRLQLRESLSTLNFLSFTRTITTRPQVNAWDALCRMCSPHVECVLYI